MMISKRDLRLLVELRDKPALVDRCWFVSRVKAYPLVALFACALWYVGSAGLLAQGDLVISTITFKTPE